MTNTQGPSGRPSKKLIYIIPAGLAVLLGGWYVFSGSTEAALDGLPVAKVAKGPLRISVLERGNIRAKKTTSIRSELEGESKILFVISEGKQVKKGDLLIELDVSQQAERRVQQRIGFDQAEASNIDAKEQLAIRVNQSESNIKKAELQLDIAKITLTKYIDGDFPQRKQEQEAKIKIAEQELSQAKDRYEWSKKLYEKGFITKTEFERDELDVNRVQINIDLAKREQNVLLTYEDPMQQKKLAADVEEAERELQRVRRQASAEHAQAEANYKARASTLELEREKLKKLESQIEKAKIFAPTDGVVVFAGGQNNGRRQEEMITVGARVNQREELMELPDPSRMVAEAKFHESVIDKVAVGQSAIVTVDTVPDRPFTGEVTYMSVVPDSQSRWLNPDLRVYRAEVSIEGEISDLRPQMSCAIEIVVEDIPDATYVPVQAVFRRGGKPVCYVVSGSTMTPQEVTLGLSNERNVEIKKGVEPGQTVLLALPPGVERELSVETPKTTVGEIVDPAAPQASGNRTGGDNVNNNGDGSGRAGNRPPGERPNGENRGMQNSPNGKKFQRKPDGSEKPDNANDTTAKPGDRSVVDR
ncbi:MAG: efflux RND transporter periplasmic adaptor subunit [Planctomycetota bacterium]